MNSWLLGYAQALIVSYAQSLAMLARITETKWTHMHIPCSDPECAHTIAYCFSKGTSRPQSWKWNLCPLQDLQLCIQSRPCVWPHTHHMLWHNAHMLVLCALPQTGNLNHPNWTCAALNRVALFPLIIFRQCRVGTVHVHNLHGHCHSCIPWYFSCHMLPHSSVQTLKNTRCDQEIKGCETEESGRVQCLCKAHCKATKPKQVQLLSIYIRWWWRQISNRSWKWWWYAEGEPSRSVCGCIVAPLYSVPSPPLAAGSKHLREASKDN